MDGGTGEFLGNASKARGEGYFGHHLGAIVEQLLEAVDLLLRIDIGLGLLLDPAFELLPRDCTRAVLINRFKRILVHPAASPGTLCRPEKLSR